LEEHDCVDFLIEQNKQLKQFCEEFNTEFNKKIAEQQKINKLLWKELENLKAKQNEVEVS